MLTLKVALVSVLTLSAAVFAAGPECRNVVADDSQTDGVVTTQDIGTPTVLPQLCPLSKGWNLVVINESQLNCGTVWIYLP